MTTGSSVLNRTFDRGEVLALFNCCDAFVSLHRAEGFGRAIAEAMLLRKPVIVTNHSGNIDFTTPDTAFLVDGPMAPLKSGDYPWGEGQYWCDPDLDMAAALMRLCCEDRERSSELALAGQSYVRERFNPTAVGRRYRRRLEELGLLQQFHAEES